FRGLFFKDREQIEVNRIGRVDVFVSLLRDRTGLRRGLGGTHRLWLRGTLGRGFGDCFRRKDLPQGEQYFLAGFLQKAGGKLVQQTPDVLGRTVESLALARHSGTL